MKRQLPSQTLEEHFLNPATRQAPLSETIRLGAQLVLQKAVELEVTEFLGRDHYQRHGEGLLRGYRNGYADKRVETGEGPLHLRMPQVRNTIDAFESVWLQSLVRRSDKLAALIPQLYVKGLSTRDIEASLTDALELEGVSKSTVSVLCKQLHQDFERWQNRDLSDQDILYLFCDGIYLRLRPEDLKAVRESFPDSWVQRCQVHRMRNILCKLPEKARPGLKRLIQKAFTAQSYKAGMAEARAVVAMYEREYPEAMKCLGTDLEESLTALRFPETHRKRIRTTNLLERLFGEGQRRSKVLPRFMNERSGLSLIFAVLVDASASWRGVVMTPAVNQQLDALQANSRTQSATRLAA